MTERPILFSTDMVRAIMNGTKTQTRRVVKGMALDWLRPEMFTPEYVANHDNYLCPYGKIGDILWVRETFQYCLIEDETHPDGGYPQILYKEKPGNSEILSCFEDPIWRPSIFMPKDAARIWLEVTDRRIERLNDISEEDARAEGIELLNIYSFPIYKDYSLRNDGYQWPPNSFKSLWDSINGKPTPKNPNPPSWESNPWVWAITFKVLSTTGKPTLPSGSKSLEETPGHGKRPAKEDQVV